MRVVLASPEAVPFAKTGGLADVASSLAKALAAQGNEVWLILPHYPRQPGRNGSEELDIEPTGDSVEVTIGSKRITGTLLRSTLPGTEVEVLLVEQPSYYDRSGLYQQDGTDYKDNCERFVFFSRAVMETVRRLDLRPDVIHSNDWQSGLIPALLEIEYGTLPGFEDAASVFTIHNIAFQGRFWHWDMELTGLDWKYFNWKQLEYFGHLSLLKTGIVFAHMITTVSPTYAREIQTEAFGQGMETVLQSRSDRLVGILNGIDTDVWNPAADPHLARNYSLGECNIADVAEAKTACKADLQRRVGLPARGDVPLFGMISRLTDQKGMDLVVESAEQLLKLDLQMVFLGTGDQKYEQALTRLAEQHPQRVATIIGFDEGLAHRIEAGADAFLMPSRYEPCGLNQMFSHVYGTVPIVRRVGGLADSVVDATEANLAAGTANGFCFEDYRSAELVRQVGRALEAYGDREKWLQLMRTGMRQDWSWRRSAAEYVEVYRQARRHRNAAPSDSLAER